MCGFCGFTGTVNNKDIVINTMMEKIIHRGPDSFGIFSNEDISLGFRRLSIIDLEDGDQPIYNEDKTLVIIFNGEIYNYQELRRELITKGHIFNSRSDTEVLIHLFEEYGEKCLDYIRGMYSFVIYNLKTKEVFAARDIFGVKPFYYTVINNNLVFASEIKSIIEYPGFKKEVNKTALENYLTFQYSVLNETFFKGVYKLFPSHYLTFKDGDLNIQRYYEPKFEPKEDMTMEEAIELIDDVVQDSVEKHKISDVTVGSFLSSGVDSSYIASSFGGEKTFTVGFEYDKYSEISYAEDLSKELNIENISRVISTEEYWSVLPKVQYSMDEPLADPSAVALYFVTKLASEHVKVSLSGEGADEFFGGYNIYKEPQDIKVLTNMPKFIRKSLGKIASAIPGHIRGKNFFIRGSKDIEERFIGNANIFSKEERERILKNPSGKYAPQNLTAPYYDRVKDLDDVTKMQFIDINFWLLGDILLKADKMSMANSLEVRVPFLDKEVFNVASKIPTHLKVGKDGTKLAFREAAKKYLPESVANKKKLGFPVPIRIWLKNDEYYKRVRNEFISETAEEYFNIGLLTKLLDDHKEGKVDNSRKIWTVYMFLVWHNEYFG